VNCFLSLVDAQQKIENWRQDYNHFRRHSSPADIPPAFYAKQFESLQPSRISDSLLSTLWEEVRCKLKSAVHLTFFGLLKVFDLTTNYIKLGQLAVANSYQDALHLDDESVAELQLFLSKMILIRTVERRLAKGRRDGLVGGPVHLGVGQEAVAVGMSSALRASDRVFGAHRSHSHLLALGSDVRKLFAEVLARQTGHSRGMGGSMHLWDQPVGFYGSVPIVAGTVSLAVGAAMAARLQDTSDVAVAYLGDGAVEEGVVHESLNLARVQREPVVFVVENNLFASHMHISLRQPSDCTARFALAHDIPSRVVDGNDVLAVARAADDLVRAARRGEGPGFLEAVTYRWYGHVDWREDIDVGVNRSQHDIDDWRAKDPVRRLVDAMQAKGLWSDAHQSELQQSIDARIEAAWNFALSDPPPPKESLLAHVYAKVEG
jgi:TPP-dependent pyruvate/acetoin dehydrogenase alpha subunit